MTESPRSIRERLDAIASRRVTPETPPNPAVEELAAGLEETLTASWNDAFGVDPLIDKALKDVRQRAREVEVALEEATSTRAEAEAGRSSRQDVAEATLEAIAAETRATDATIAASRKAIEVGRERLVRELLPEPRRGYESSEAKGDIALIVQGFENPMDGMRHAVARAVEADDRIALGLLAGTYGETLFRARGGRPESFAGIRAELIRLVADNATRKSPRSTEARKWAVVLTDPATKYVTGEGTRTRLRLQDADAAVPRSEATKGATR